MRSRASWFVCLVGTLLVSSEAHADWRDWWWTQEQRAQRALDAGQAEQAAQLFSDPQRRAYAEIAAGQYGSAAQRLAPLRDPEAQYNRGNALARAGDLRGALAAYDAALERAGKGSVTERDARHNRELVARQLEKQQEQQQQRDQKGKQDQQQQQSGTQQQGGGEPQKNEDSQPQGRQSQSAGQPSEQPQGGRSGSSDQNGSSGMKPPADRAKDESSAAQSQGDAQADAKEPAAQANEANDRAREAAGIGRDERNPARATNQDSPPTTERALAVEQWLRQIPDDPGGLLRRKFQLEHQRKRREARP